MIGLGLACCGFTYACVGVGKRAKHIHLICICLWAVQRFAFVSLVTKRPTKKTSSDVMWARVGARIGPVSGALAARVPFDELHKVSSASCKHLGEQRTGAAAAWAW